MFNKECVFSYNDKKELDNVLNERAVLVKWIEQTKGTLTIFEKEKDEANKGLDFLQSELNRINITNRNTHLRGYYKELILSKKNRIQYYSDLIDEFHIKVRILEEKL